MSSSSASSSTTESSYLDAAFGRNQYRPRSRTLAGWYRNNLAPSGTLPSNLRPSHSCPAFLHLPIRMVSPNQLAEKDRGISWGANTVDTGAMAGMPSLVFSSEAEDWISMRGKGQGLQEKRQLPRRVCPPREIVMEHRRRIGS